MINTHSQDILEAHGSECNDAQKTNDLDSLSANKSYQEATKDMIEIAIVDMAWPRDKIREGLMYQLKNLGFLVLSNVDGYDEEQLLRAAKWLFSLDPEEKRILGQKHHYEHSKNYYRGLAPFMNNDISHKELFDMGLEYSKVSDFEKQFSLHEETPFP